LRSVPTIHPAADLVPLSRFALHDIESARLMFRGSSVVDWVRLNFSTDREIDAFIRVNQLDPNSREDTAWMRAVQQRAVDYLERHLRYRIPEVIRDADHLRVLFQFASRTKGRRTHRFYACLVLKVMHIIHHVDSHDLLLRLPISDAEVAVLLQARIEHKVRGLLERGFPLVEFSGNRKRLWSIYSKLLAKKNTQSAKVLDKLRFRFVVERPEDIPPLLLTLSRELLPFNYVLPGQTHNSLVDLQRMLNRAGNVLAYSGGPPRDWNESAAADLVPAQKNEFSGPEYRVVNFVTDVPLRVDRMLGASEALTRELGPVVFGAVEFQIVDRETGRKNELGDNRHAAYKGRQRQKVKQRLEAGRRKRPASEDAAALDGEEASA